MGGAGEVEGDNKAGDLGAPGALVEPVALYTSGAKGTQRVRKGVHEIYELQVTQMTQGLQGTKDEHGLRGIKGY